jgi:glutathione peroxidase
MPNTFYDFSAESIEGNTIDFSIYQGSKVLVVNTASECGLTPQYAQLEELYREFGSSGFTILGFPSNDFAGQEPGTDTEIAEFCKVRYGVSFPLFSKVEVKGNNAHPIFKWLADSKNHEVESTEPQWNFHKYLVNEDGQLYKSVAPTESPLSDVILDWIRS